MNTNSFFYTFVDNLLTAEDLDIFICFNCFKTHSRSSSVNKKIGRPIWPSNLYGS